MLFKNESAVHQLSVAEVGKQVQARKVSPVDLVANCLKSIEEFNPRFNAFITVTADRALQEAGIAEKEMKVGRWRSPLHGIPVGVKDFFDTAGIRTTAAHGAFKDRVPSKDAEVVTKLREAGAIVIGKTNMHELGMGTTSLTSYFGAVRNPWNEEYVAGGSSGGSGAAVAAGLCYATVDTDAIGSCRLPASCCGVIGFKATYGLLSTKGILDGEPVDEMIARIGHTAFMCRTVEDAAILLNVLATRNLSRGEFKTDYRSAFGSTKHLKIGVVRNFRATDEIRVVFREAVDAFRSIGYVTSDIDAPLEFSKSDVKNIESDRETVSKTLFKSVGALVLPTTSDITPSIEAAKGMGEQAVSADNTFFCNYYGLPAISVPCGFSKNGLPLGLQIVGPQWGEGVVLDVAHRYQQTTHWSERHPGD